MSYDKRNDDAFQNDLLEAINTAENDLIKSDNIKLCGRVVGEYGVDVCSCTCGIL